MVRMVHRRHCHGCTPSGCSSASPLLVHTMEDPVHDMSGLPAAAPTLQPSDDEAKVIKVSYDLKEYGGVMTYAIEAMYVSLSPSAFRGKGHADRCSMPQNIVPASPHPWCPWKMAKCNRFGSGKYTFS